MCQGEAGNACRWSRGSKGQLGRRVRELGQEGRGEASWAALWSRGLSRGEPGHVGGARPSDVDFSVSFGEYTRGKSGSDSKQKSRGQVTEVVTSDQTLDLIPRTTARWSRSQNSQQQCRAAAGHDVRLV